MINKMKSLNNKGVTLVELLLAMAILVIIGGAITTFMITGTNSYTKTSNEVNLQYEAQLTSNQINDLLVDATEDVTFVVGGATATSEDPIADDVNKELRILTSFKDGEIDEDGDGENDSIEMKYVLDVLQWQADTKQLWYSQYDEYDSDGDGKVDTAGSLLVEPELMAEYVDVFSANLADVEKGKNLKVILHFDNKGKEFAANGNVTLRNFLAVNTNTVTGIIPPTPGVDAITGVIITPATVILEPGSTGIFSAVVRGAGLVDQRVDWSVPSICSPGTTIDSAGRLRIDPDETADELNVVATSVADPTKSAIATVSIKKAVAVTITSSKSNISKKDTFTLTATVTGRNITDSAADQSVIWEVEEGAAYVAPRGASNIFYVDSKCPVGTKVTIRATSAISSSASGVFSFYVKGVTDDDPDDPSEGGEIDGDDTSASIRFDGWPPEIKRGGGGTFAVKVTNGSGYHVEFEVNAVDGDGKAISSSFLSGSKNGNSYSVELSKSYAFTKTGTVYVTAYLVADGKTKDDYSSKAEASAPIKAVALKFALEEGKAFESVIKDLPKIYATGKSVKVYYTLEGIIESDIDWKMYDKDGNDASNILSISQESDKGYFLLSAKSGKRIGEVADAAAYLGKYKLYSSIQEVTVLGGNLKVATGYSGQAGYGTFDLYVPLPGDSDKYDKVKGAKYNVGNQWYSGFDGQGYHGDARFQITNVDHTFYVYYKYDMIANVWYIIVTNTICDDANWKPGLSVVQIEGKDCNYQELKYKPGESTTWQGPY